MNFRSGQFVVDNGDPWFELSGLRQPLCGYEFHERPQPGQPIVLGIRPEHVQIHPNGGITHSASADLIEPMGAETIVWTKIAGEPFSIRVEGDAPVESGDGLELGFPANRLNLFDAESGVRL